MQRFLLNLHIFDELMRFSAYLDNGLLVENAKLSTRRYLKSSNFRKDIMAMLPTDLLYFVIGSSNP